MTVKTIKTDTQSRIEVLSGGIFTNINPNGKGLAFVRDVCEKSQGKFLIEQSLSHTKAIMSFKNSDINLRPSLTDYTDIFSILNDRLSPACIEMFGMEYH